MNAYTEQIKERISIKDAFERYGVEINSRGFASCPFHNEKTASMKLYQSSFYCFGCGAGGDVITFVRLLFNLDFPDAVRKLSEDFGLNLFQLDYRAKMRFHEENRRREAERKRRAALTQQYEMQCLWRTRAFRLARQQAGQLKPSCTSPPTPRYFELLRVMEYLEYWFDENKTFEKWEARHERN